MANPTFPLRNEMDRQRAIACLQKIDLDAGWTWTMREEVRSDQQNRRMWAMLRDISRQVEWYGRKLDEESWKHVFSAAVQQQDAVPGINGGFDVVKGLATQEEAQAFLAKWLKEQLPDYDTLRAEVDRLTAEHQIEIERHRTTREQLEQAKREGEALRIAANLAGQAIRHLLHNIKASGKRIDLGLAKESAITALEEINAAMQEPK